MHAVNAGVSKYSSPNRQSHSGDLQWSGAAGIHPMSRSVAIVAPIGPTTLRHLRRVGVCANRRYVQAQARRMRGRSPLLVAHHSRNHALTCCRRIRTAGSHISPWPMAMADVTQLERGTPVDMAASDRIRCNCVAGMPWTSAPKETWLHTPVRYSLDACLVALASWRTRPARRLALAARAANARRLRPVALNVIPKSLAQVAISSRMPVWARMRARMACNTSRSEPTSFDLLLMEQPLASTPSTSSMADEATLSITDAGVPAANCARSSTNCLGASTG